MKTFRAFVLGVVLTYLVIWVSGYYSTKAKAADEPVPQDESTSLTEDTSLSSLLPDIRKIYESALGSPYRQVESEITDPDIAAFFQRYMDETGLDKIGLEPGS